MQALDFASAVAPDDLIVLVQAVLGWDVPPLC